jgi:hypothetical protein
MNDADDALEAMQDLLNRFEAKDIHRALGDLEPQASDGPDGAAAIVGAGPLDFGSIEPGVLVYRTESGRVRLRVTWADIEGGSYDEVEGSEGSVGRLVDALVSALERSGASEDP